MAQAPASRTDGFRSADDPESGPPGANGSGNPEPAEPDGRTRRGLLIGAGLAGVAGLAAACGGGSAGPGGGGGDSGGGGAAAGTALARTSEIPVGGGKIIKAHQIVVVQPSQGRFKAYDAACTHRGCSVETVVDGMIGCPCHGSKFKIADGSVAGPPALDALPEKRINVQGDQITLA